MSAPVIVSLFDLTGEAVRPWAEAGHECLCFDLQHPRPRSERVGHGWIHFWPWDATTGIADIAEFCADRSVRGVFCWAPCTDLAGLGAQHWGKKREADPQFQQKAVAWVRMGAELAALLGPDVWSVSENPVGAVSSLWRKPDYTFNPCDYGGYILPGQEEHPTWPDHIPARDAYTKRTCLWTTGPFKMPPKRPVEPVVFEYRRKDGTVVRGSPQWGKLGGKSLKTKNIRSATPRGFSRAVFESNGLRDSAERNAA